MKKTKIISLFFLATLLCPIISFIPSAMAAANNSEKTLSLLSNVFNIDLSKYTIKLDRVTEHSTTDYGSNVTRQSVSYTLKSDDSIVSAESLFIGDLLKYCNLYIDKGDPIYTQKPSADLLEQSKNVLQRYCFFAGQNGASDSYLSYLSSMAILLNQLSELKTTSITAGNIRLNVTVYQARASNTPLQTFEWFYLENGVEVSKKAVTLDFTDGVLTSIRDTWNLYSVGSTESISQSEAEAIAYAAAQNYALEFRYENGSTYSEKADLSNVTTQVKFSMEQRSGEDSALYPFWDVQFWFNGRPHGSQVRGIEVGIWGDTKEVKLCQAIVVLGGEDPSQSETSDGTVAGNEAFPISIIAVASVAGLIVALVAVGLVVKKKRNKQ